MKKECLSVESTLLDLITVCPGKDETTHYKEETYTCLSTKVEFLSD